MPIAERAPAPPSVVAEPPQPTMMRRAPRATARMISSPVPVVEARIGSLLVSPPAIKSPEAFAISMTAVGLS